MLDVETLLISQLRIRDTNNQNFMLSKDNIGIFLHSCDFFNISFCNAIFFYFILYIKNS